MSAMSPRLHYVRKALIVIILLVATSVKVKKRSCDWSVKYTDLTACHVSCALECTGPGKGGCVECKKGYEQLNGSCEGRLPSVSPGREMMHISQIWMNARRRIPATMRQKFVIISREHSCASVNQAMRKWKENVRWLSWNQRRRKILQSRGNLQVKLPLNPPPLKVTQENNIHSSTSSDHCWSA